MLSVLVWMPIVGASLIGFWPQFQGEADNDAEIRISTRSKWIALLIISATLLWVIYLGTQFDLNHVGYQFEEDLPWLEPLGLRYKLGLDGLALILVALNALLTGISIYSSALTLERPRLYYSLLLLINAGVAGAFLAENVLLFFLFYELELIPLYLLIAAWGGARREYAATKFLIYTAISGILILAVFLGLAWLNSSASFDYQELVHHTLPLVQQLILLTGILVGFGIKIPLVPFHTWLPDAHVEASTPISVLLAGVLLKLGTYGLLRFGLGLFPEAWQVVAPWLATWAAISALYGALLAIAQTDMKKMVAYSSIAHMAYILLAAAAATPLSVVASILQMISHGLISALLFLLVGVVYSKTGTRDLNILQGLLNPERGLPLVGSMMVLGVMASSGIPGMVGFVAEFLVFRGSFPIFPIQTLFCMVSTGLTAVYFLLLVNRAFFGRLKAGGKQFDPLQDEILPTTTWFDHAPGLILAALIVLLGLQPNWMTVWTNTTADTLLAASVPVETQNFAFLPPDG